MDNDMIKEPWNLRVCDHAVERYRERSGGDKVKPETAANILRNIVIKGREMVFKNKADELKQILKHDCNKARYFQDGLFMVVVENGVIVTTHLAEANKWKRKNA